MNVRLRRFTRPFTIACALALLIAPSRNASAAVPSAARSTLPACIATTPGGNILSVIIVHDFADNPCPNSSVVIDYSQCPGFVPCAQSAPPDSYVVDVPNHRISRFTSPTGRVTFALRAGGGCSAAGIRVFADGIVLGDRHAASADQTGDLTVNAADIAAVQAKVGSLDLSGDLDGNGAVDANDVALVTNYYGITCLNATPTTRHTWGMIKTIYR